MTDFKIHPDTKIGDVHLTVSDLDNSLQFYQQSLGFRVRRREGDTAYLGAGAQDLLVLTQDPNARRLPRRTGLYHFAVLVPSRFELAQSLRRIAETRTPVEGFADHLVSEAIYLPDPDGNGIEIYRDRPRSQWRYSGDSIRMATDPLDLDDLLNELEGKDQPWQGLASGTTIGHMHLHVAHLGDTQDFYNKLLGFDLMASLAGSALFVSAGGYHHHIGLNTWQGVGAPPPPPGSIGLRYFTVRLPDEGEVEKVSKRVIQAGMPVKEHPDGLLLRDPSSNGIVLTAKV